jgi:hypothetical protein
MKVVSCISKGNHEKITLIPVVLDQATNTYNKWRGMFLIVLGKYALTSHVLEDESFPDRPA